MNFYK